MRPCWAGNPRGGALQGEGEALSICPRIHMSDSDAGPRNPIFLRVSA